MTNEEEAQSWALSPERRLAVTPTAMEWTQNSSRV